MNDTEQSRQNEDEYRRQGRYLTAIDIANRLMPDLDMNEALLWPPDLFAYTSYILLKTSAYQLVVSPPSKKCWPPTKDDIMSWLYYKNDVTNADKHLQYWHDQIKTIWGGGESRDFDAYKNNVLKELIGWKENHPTYEEKAKELSNQKHNLSDWEYLVRKTGREWKEKLKEVKSEQFKLIDDCKPPYEERRGKDDEYIKKHKTDREKQLLNILLENTPPLLLACWAFFYKQINDKVDGGFPLQVTDLLCNQDQFQNYSSHCDKLWNMSQALLTMHAIADIAGEEYGLKAETSEDEGLAFASRLLIGRIKYSSATEIGGSLSTFNIERCRVLPKRHNPNIGITLRSLSSNLTFHQSAVDVVWRQTENNTLNTRFLRTIANQTNNSSGEQEEKQTLSVLLLPFPLAVHARDFKTETSEAVDMSDEFGFFSYDPHQEKTMSKKRDAGIEEIEKAIKLIGAANKELADPLNVDMILFPETSLSMEQFSALQTRIKEDPTLNPDSDSVSLEKTNRDKMPSIIIAGVRESKEELAKESKERNAKMDELRKAQSERLNGESNVNIEKVRQGNATDYNFPRNAVYCQYLDTTKDGGTYYNGVSLDSQITPKYKQYKHHRWRLEESQIKSYGLSSVLDPRKIWWEFIKIPKRRVSFLNVGDRLTISHLICEDLARQDPIAELVRHVGPSLVVTLLMDGPQLASRWSSRYATVLSDDPGCAVITLTSMGMVKRHHTQFGLMSRVIALWNDGSSGHSREIELAQDAEAVLLTLTTDKEYEKTADGREERTRTTALRLHDVIQIYRD